MTNRLANSTSPYLLQHKDNPVDWWEWGDDAFAEARRRDVPLLVSIGYSACHWCHVMAHESFEDVTIAAQVNESFVPVKVDREERPDVDSVYMEATQAMTGQGGWPMTVFATPEGEPFYCGTYFPPAPRQGMPSFPMLLAAIASTWRERRGEVVAAAADVVGRLRGSSFPRGDAPPDEALLGQAVATLAREEDRQRGGLGGAPKFPPSMTLEQLLRHSGRTGDAEALAIVERTCAAMARGGIYDQLGGGFARYSVDASWVVPHFEKMLYDNALLLRAYLHWWRATGSDLARRVTLETADFMLRELRTPEGGFASALDADSEGEEGRFYVWTPQQLHEVLGEDVGRRAAEWFSVTPGGTFENGASVLQRLTEPDDLDAYEQVRAALLRARAARVRPGRDDKVVAAWNGLAIAALAETGALLERPALVEAARSAADLLLSVHVVDGRLVRTSRDGRAGLSAGVLEDHGDVAEGLLALYAVTGEGRWYAAAGRLLEFVLTLFTDESGVMHDTASDAERLVHRPRDPTDNAVPSGTSAAAGALLTYAALSGSGRHREAAERALATAGVLAAAHPRFAGWGLAVAEALADGPREVAVVGAAGDPARAALHRSALASTAPGVVVAVGEPDQSKEPESPGRAPLLTARPLVGGSAAAYVCRGFVCAAPVTDPADLTAQLSRD